MPTIPRISETEWELMRVVWARSPLTAAEIIAELRTADPTWHPKTVRTLLNRLVKKKALGHRPDGRANQGRRQLWRRHRRSQWQRCAARCDRRQHHPDRANRIHGLRHLPDGR